MEQEQSARTRKDEEEDKKPSRSPPTRRPSARFGGPCASIFPCLRLVVAFFVRSSLDFAILIAYQQ